MEIKLQQTPKSFLNVYKFYKVINQNSFVKLHFKAVILSKIGY